MYRCFRCRMKNARSIWTLVEEKHRNRSILLQLQKNFPIQQEQQCLKSKHLDGKAPQTSQFSHPCLFHLLFIHDKYFARMCKCQHHETFRTYKCWDQLYTPRCLKFVYTWLQESHYLLLFSHLEDEFQFHIENRMIIHNRNSPCPIFHPQPRKKMNCF